MLEASNFSQTHPLWIIGITFVVTLIPLIVGATTSYLKISIVFSLVRNGFGLQQTPNGLVVMVLSFALSLLVMSSVIDTTGKSIAEIPLEKLRTAPTAELLSQAQVVLRPWREFMLAHSGAREISVLRDLSAGATSTTQSESPPLSVLLPAFILSELKEAFTMGFLLLLPFLVIDLVVANILAGLGMYMLSPAMISLPLKIIIFISIDGWLLLSRSLILSYGVHGVS